MCTASISFCSRTLRKSFAMVALPPASSFDAPRACWSYTSHMVRYSTLPAPNTPCATPRPRPPQPIRARPMRSLAPRILLADRAVKTGAATVFFTNSRLFMDVSFLQRLYLDQIPGRPLLARQQARSRRVADEVFLLAIPPQLPAGLDGDVTEQARARGQVSQLDARERRLARPEALDPIQRVEVGPVRALHLFPLAPG